MPLPQQVIEQLSHEQPKAQGWSSGILFFSGGILAIVIVLYAGLAFGYTPYLNSQITQTQDQLNKESQAITSTDQAKLIMYYSEVSNLHNLVSGHVYFSNFLNWLEANTEANVYYGSMSFSSGDQVTLATFAKTQADVNQQIRIFESSPEVQGVSVSSISFSAAAQAWTFNATLTLEPQLFLWQMGSQSTTAAATGFATPIQVVSSTPSASTSATTTTTATTTP